MLEFCPNLKCQDYNVITIYVAGNRCGTEGHCCAKSHKGYIRLIIYVYGHCEMSLVEVINFIGNGNGVKFGLELSFMMN